MRVCSSADEGSVYTVEAALRARQRRSWYRSGGCIRTAVWRTDCRDARVGCACAMLVLIGRAERPMSAACRRRCRVDASQPHAVDAHTLPSLREECPCAWLIDCSIAVRHGRVQVECRSPPLRHTAAVNLCRLPRAVAVERRGTALSRTTVSTCCTTVFNSSCRPCRRRCI